MTTTIEYPSSDSGQRIFLLSAFGSAIIHAALLAWLAYLPNPPAVEDTPPTIHVKLVPALQEVSPASQVPTKSLAPGRPDLPHPTPPAPRLQSTQPTPAPPLQASLKPAPSIPLAPPPPVSQAQPMLKDVRTDQALKSRHMMKMAVPHRPDQQFPLSPDTSQREQPPVRMPLNLNSQQSSAQHKLPPPPSPAALTTLKAPPPIATGSSTSRPMIVSSSKPLYPRIARESGWEGTVIVRTLITTDGIPSKVEIRKSCGHEALDLAAQEAIKTWKFQPAKDGNIPVAKWVDIPIRFDLNS